MNFKTDFLWGAGTSAFQYEGPYFKDGKGVSTADKRNEQLNLANKGISVSKCDANGYCQYKDDIKLMKELGLKSYRFSISWSRLIPSGDGPINQKALAYYNDVINELVKAGIEPIVTLLHFDLPWKLKEKFGGFESRKLIDSFVKYAKICFDNFGDRVHYWLTINEQNVMTRLPNMCGLNDKDPEKDKKLTQINYNLFIANAKAVILSHKLYPNNKIGPAVSYPTYYPKDINPKNIIFAYDVQVKSSFETMTIYALGEIPMRLMNEWKIHKVVPQMKDDDKGILKQGTADFLGLNWYCTTTIGRNDKEIKLNFDQNVDLSRNPYLKYGKWGWDYDPEALRMALEEVEDRFHLPLMITENGWSEEDSITSGKVHDPIRVKYLRDHVISMYNAINEGVNLIGYQYWSFVDISSSSQGFNKRYGLIYVNDKQPVNNKLPRIPKDSFYYYKKIIASNGQIAVKDIKKYDRN